MLTAIVDEINARAEPLVRRLQEIRQRPMNKLLHTEKRFVEKGWTFHIGGRTELQFNVGLEPLEGKDHLRHGVAFSFEPSRNYPWNDLIKVLRPKVDRFNEFVRRYPDEFLDLRMWHWRKIRRQDKRSERPDRMPSPIQPELVALGVFVFLGQLQPMEAIDYEVVLDDFDRLLPLYEFVEGTSAFPTLTPAGNGFHFQAGYTEGLARTTANIPARELDVDLRHNRLRKALYLTLSQCFGADAVSSRSCLMGSGGVSIP